MIRVVNYKITVRLAFEPGNSMARVLCSRARKVYSGENNTRRFQIVSMTGMRYMLIDGSGCLISNHDYKVFLGRRTLVCFDMTVSDETIIYIADAIEKSGNMWFYITTPVCIRRQ